MTSYSEGERIAAYENPAPMMLSDDYIDKNAIEVLKLLAIKGTCFTSEISRDLGIHIETTNKLLNSLVRKKYIKKFIPDRYHPQNIIAVRIPQLQSSGMDNYEKVSRASWWVITVTGIDYLKLKCKGEGVQIKGAVLKYWELPYPEDD